MNLEERLQTLLIEREQTLTKMEEAVQKIQNLLVLRAREMERDRHIRLTNHYF